MNHKRSNLKLFKFGLFINFVVFFLASGFLSTINIPEVADFWVGLGKSTAEQAGIRNTFEQLFSFQTGIDSYFKFIGFYLCTILVVIVGVVVPVKRLGQDEQTILRAEIDYIDSGYNKRSKIPMNSYLLPALFSVFSIGGIFMLLGMGNMKTKILINTLSKNGEILQRVVDENSQDNFNDNTENDDDQPTTKEEEYSRNNTVTLDTMLFYNREPRETAGYDRRNEQPQQKEVVDKITDHDFEILKMSESQFKNSTNNPSELFKEKLYYKKNDDQPKSLKRIKDEIEDIRNDIYRSED